MTRHAAQQCASVVQEGRLRETSHLEPALTIAERVEAALAALGNLTQAEASAAGLLFVDLQRESECEEHRPVIATSPAPGLYLINLRGEGSTFNAAVAEFTRLAILAAFAECETATAAAARLGVSTSFVTRSLASYGVRLQIGRRRTSSGLRRRPPTGRPVGRPKKPKSAEPVGLRFARRAALASVPLAYAPRVADDEPANRCGVCRAELDDAERGYCDDRCETAARVYRSRRQFGPVARVEVRRA